jgi:hypothetical protein
MWASILELKPLQISSGSGENNGVAPCGAT